MLIRLFKWYGCTSLYFGQRAAPCTYLPLLINPVYSTLQLFIFKCYLFVFNGSKCSLRHAGCSVLIFSLIDTKARIDYFKCVLVLSVESVEVRFINRSLDGAIIWKFDLNLAITLKIDFWMTMQCEILAGDKLRKFQIVITCN